MALEARKRQGFRFFLDGVPVSTAARQRRIADLRTTPRSTDYPESYRLPRWPGRLTFRSSSAVAQCFVRFSALFEREARARSSADRAGGFGPFRPMRCNADLDALCEVG